jgi:transcription initiation factor TFIIB
MNRIEENICPRCNARDSKVTDSRSGEIVCQNCGLVFEERIIDDTYEKRNFSNENGGNKGESRIGGPMKAGEENNLGSTLVTIDKNGRARKTRGANGAYNQSPIERNFEEIDKILSNQDIKKSLIEETKEIYNQVTKVLKMKGRNLKTMICAMYFIASRKANLSKSFKEISKMFGVEEKRIKKAYNYIKHVVVNSLSPDQLNETIINYIRSLCEVNNEKYPYIKLSSDIAKKINESCLLEGRNTRTITGISLLIASKLIKTENVNKKLICNEFVTENTMDNVFDKIRNSLDKIIPEEYKSQINNLSIK